MTKKLIFLDDERNVEDVTWLQYPFEINKVDITIVRTYQQFVEAVDKLESFENVFFSFDHDLADFFSCGSVEATGKDCAQYLIDCCLDCSEHFKADHIQYVVHSQNPIGKQNIELLLNHFKQFCIDNVKEPLQCDGCGYIGDNVYTDAGGFNICSSGKCNSYSVRGLSQSDFY